MIDQNLERGKLTSEMMGNKFSKRAQRGENLLKSTQNLRPGAEMAGQGYQGGQGQGYQGQGGQQQGMGQGGQFQQQDDFATEYSNKFNMGESRKPLRNFMQVSQSAEIQPQWTRKPRNDYEFIMGKNGHHAGNFNIISNKLKKF